MLASARAALLAAILFAPRINAQTAGQLPLEKGIQLPAPSDDTTRADEDRVAVVVGVDHYDSTSGFPDLRFAQNDADGMVRALTRAGYLVKRIPESGASAGAILDAIDEQGKMLMPVRGVGKQGTFLFYFSGHGTAVEHQNFLVTSHASRQRLTRDALGLDEVEAALAKTPARRKILFIDACRTGPQTGARDIVGSDRFTEFRAAEGERMLLAAPFGDPSREFPELSHGVFTYFLLKVFESDPADIAGRSYVTFSDLARYVSRETRQWTNAKGFTQVPLENSLDAAGDFLVAGGSNDSGPAVDVADLASRGRALVLQKKYAEAMPFLRQAAAAKGRIAMFTIGLLYERGFGVLQNYTDAITWYLRANDLGEPRAATALGALYRSGRGVSVDYSLALRYFSKAATAGDADAMAAIGALYREGDGVPRDNELAMMWYRKAAVTGSDGAMNEIGYLYHRGIGVAQDYLGAMTWYRKGAEAGNKESMYNMGVLFEQGLGVAQDYREAMSWYRKAADAGSSEGMASVGFLYGSGKGVPIDYNETMTWYRKAADAGNVRAMKNIGILYTNGQGVPRDGSKALDWCRKAADLGDTSAMRVIAFLYLTKKVVSQEGNEPLLWMQKAADAGDPAAMRAIGLFYEGGFGGVVKDQSQAISWLRKAAAAGSTEAQADVKRLGRGQ